MLDLVLQLAQKNAFLFPLLPKSKGAAIKRWQHYASSDLVTLQLQFESTLHRLGGFNVGMLMGKRSGMLGFDIDYDEGAPKDFIRQLPISWTVKSGKGHHVYYRYPESWPDFGLLPLISRKTDDGKTKPCVSVRGNGHYFLVPPSIHPETGNEYQWAKYEGWSDAVSCDLLSPWEIPLGNPPEWILEAWEKKQTKISVKVNWKPGRGGTASKRRYSADTRHAMFVATAANMRKEGYGADEIASRLALRNQLDCDPPKENAEDELGRIVQWAMATVQVDPARAAKEQERIRRRERSTQTNRGRSSISPRPEPQTTSPPQSPTGERQEHQKTDGYEDGAHCPVPVLEKFSEPDFRSFDAPDSEQPADPASSGNGPDVSSADAWQSSHEPDGTRGLPPEPTASPTPASTEATTFFGSKSIVPLGHLDSDYYYLSTSNRQICRLSFGAHGAAGLMHLMPWDYWFAEYGSVNKQGNEVVNWYQAGSDLMDSCRRAGIFNPKRMRGAGAWRDNGKLVLHLGNSLIVDNCHVDLLEYDSRNTYRLGPELPAPTAWEAGLEECRTLIEACKAASWEKESSGTLLAGGLAVLRLCGALPWRPHLWITGPATCGKTTVMNQIVDKMSGEWGMKFRGSTTEAGIRQGLDCDSRPVIFDESETNDKKSGSRVRVVLELARQASSEGDGVIAKGTPDGRGLTFSINSSFVLASIRVNLTQEADITRFTVLELARPSGSDPVAFWKRLDALTHEMGNRIFTRMVRRFDVLMESNRVIASAIRAAGGGHRLGDQYGILLAGYALLTQDTVVTEEQAGALVREAGIVDRGTDSTEPDEVECIRHLASTVARYQVADGVREGTIAELGTLAEGMPKGEASRALQSLGIRVSRGFVVVANGFQGLGKIFKDTKWDESWKNSLVRLAGAERIKQRIGAGNPIWCVKIPISHLIGSAEVERENPLF